MNYEKFCEGTLGGCALASPMPFLDKKSGCPAQNLQHDTHYIASQKQGFYGAFPAGLAPILDTPQNACKGPCVASHNARACNICCAGERTNQQETKSILQNTKYITKNRKYILQNTLYRNNIKQIERK